MAQDKLLKQGIEFHNAGKLSEALSLYNVVLKNNPSHAHSLRLSGLAKLQLGAFNEAISFLEKALSIEANQVEALSNLGLAYTQCENYQAALKTLSKARTLDPTNIQVLNNLGVLFRHLNEHEKAIELFEIIIKSTPDAFMALNNLAYHYDQQGDFKTAEAYAKKAVRLKPDEKTSRQTLAAIYTHQQQYEKANTIYQQLLEVDNQDTEIRFHFALMLADSGETTEAINQFKSILDKDADNVEAQWNLSLALLKSNDFKNGWQRYGNFWNKRFNNPLVPVELPWWSIQTPSTSRCLIRTEQGVGDEIMFSSVIPDLLNHHTHLTLECDARLQSLFERSFPGLKTIPKDQISINQNDYDVQAKMADLFVTFRDDPKSFNQNSGYLKSDKKMTNNLIKAYKTEFPNKLRVGFSWLSGNKQNGHQRSIPLSALEPLFKLEGIHWFNCQYGENSDEIKGLSEQTQTRISSAPCDQATDLNAYASFISALDLVVSIDNSSVHMAGALNTPVWVLLNHNADWRWGIKEEKSYWYPSATLIRQDSPGEWLSPLSKVKQMLITRLKERC